MKNRIIFVCVKYCGMVFKIINALYKMFMFHMFSKLKGWLLKLQNEAHQMQNCYLKCKLFQYNFDLFINCCCFGFS